MRSPRFPRRSAKQLIALTLVIQIGWVTTPVYSLSRSAPQAVAVRVESSKPPSEPRREKAATSGLPISALTPHVSIQGQHFAYVANLGSNIISAVATAVRNVVATFAAGSAPRSTAVTSAQQQCAPPPSGIVSWWPGDGNANDIQGDNNGTLQNGATFAPGVVGQAFSLDGVNDYVDVGDVDLPSTFSIEAWVKTNSLGNYQQILNKEDGVNLRSYFLGINPNGALALVVRSVLGSRDFTTYITNSPAVSAGNWQHIVVTYDGSAGPNLKMKFYVNGVNVPATPAPGEDNGGAPENNSLSAKIGILGDVIFYPFNGLIDELAAYNRVLTTPEIQAIYNAGSAGKCKPTATNFAYVTNRNSGTVSVIDTASNQVVDTISVGGFPLGIVLTPDNTRLYVTKQGSNTVSVIDTASRQLIATIQVGSDPTFIAISPDGARAYVVTRGSNALSVIETAGNTVTDIIPAGTDPVVMAITPDGARAYVVNRGPSTVTVIDTVNKKIITTIQVGSFPEGIAITPDGTRAYVANDGNGPGSVSVINIVTNSVIPALPVPSATFVAITPDGAFAYVTGYRSGRVTVMETASNQIVDSIAVGSNPIGIAVTPDGSRAYVANISSNNVSVIDTATRKVVATVSVGTTPFYVAITPIQQQGDLTSLTLNPTTVNGGQPSTGTVTLSGPAPAGGAEVTLSSGETSVATVPASVTVAEGATSATFTVTTNPVATDSTATISASYGGGTRTATLTVTAPLADLQVSSVNAPSQAFADSAFDLSWTVVNSGQSRANGPWSDKVFLSTDNQLGGDTQLGPDFPFAQSLDPGQSAARTQVMSIPRAAIPADGQYFLIVATDANNNVNEGGENNNWRAVPITVNRIPFPDLIVEAIQAPDTAFFDQTITVQWTVRNVGNGSTDASGWNDQVFLSRDRTLNEVVFQTGVSNVSYLNAGERYVASANMRIPRGLFGTFYFIVSTDSGNAVAEDVENNNTLDRAINLQVPPVPDLQVTLVQGPEEAFPGEPMFVNWRVENRGNGNTPPEQGTWFDGIYLSQDQNFTNPRLIGSRRHEGGLTQGDGYTVNGFSVEVPRNIVGDWYVFVVADYQNSVYEFVGENNNGNLDATHQIPVRATPPDLIVTSVTAPDTGAAARQITVNWTVKNQGAFEANASWFDTVYLSPDDTPDPKTDKPLGTVSRGSNLGPGLSYDASATVALTACITGTYYVYVYTDSRDQLFEFDPNEDAEQNNFSELKAVQITSNPPDLRVTAVINGTSGNAGQPVSMSWTVANNGVGPTVEGSWEERVYLSQSPAFNQGTALLAGSFAHIGDLAPNETYTTTQNVTLPTTAQGTYYVFVLTNPSNAVEECGNGSNNVGGSPVTINVTNNQPDLTVVSVSAPGGALAGQGIAVQWSASNAGTAAAVQNQSWNDAVYFSADANLDDRDARLGTVIKTGPLAVGAAYQAQAQVTIPVVAAGTYYLIVRADDGNFLFEAQREDNNAGYAVVQIDVPSVDLQVTDVSAPAESVSGQEMPVSWTIVNTNSMPTNVSQWTDYVILSRDQIYDPTDRVIGYKTRIELLDAGGSYTATVNAIVPPGLSGPYYVFVRTDFHNSVAETNEANNVGGPRGLMLQLPPPVDLTVTAINAPGSGSPGEASTFRWTVQNIGPNTVTGGWGDAVYLSQDSVWDIGDALVGRVDRGGPLGVGQTYEGELTTVLPAVDPGQYFVIVRTDVRNNVREQDETNNTNASGAAMAVDVTELQLGVPRNSTLQTDQERFFKVNVPGSETLLFTLDGQNPLASNELYARHGAVPSRSAFDFLFSRPNESDQEIVVPDTLAGFYYSLARAAYVPPGSTNPVTIKAEIVPFSIRSVSPNRIGDNGQVTLTIKGAKFQEGATVKLVGSGTTLTAAKVMVLDSATIKARFILTNTPHGIYDLVLTNPGDSPAIVSSAITVETTTMLLAQLNITGNLFPRAGGHTQLLGELKSLSNVDIPYACIQGAFSGPARIGWIRPMDSAPLQAAFPDEDWQYNSPTAFFDGSETVDTYCLRNIEPRQNTVLALNISNIPAGSFKVRLNYHLENAAKFVEQQEDMYESLRQLYISDPSLPLLPDLSSLVADPVQWWQYFKQSLIADGYLDEERGQSLLTPSVNISLQAADIGCNEEVCFGRAEDKAEECAKKAIRDSRTLVTLSRRLDRCRLDKIEDFADCNFKPCIPPDDPCSQAETGTCSPTNNGQCCNGDGRRAFDPNDKQAPSGFGPQAFVVAKQLLPYTVNFENVPTATAAAQRIRIVDQLDPNLDWRTFRVKEIGFGNYRITVPENRAFFQTRIQLGEDLGNLLADISARLDIATGQVTWTLTAIDPQTGEQPAGALLGLLPPNDDTGRGQGYVTYTILPKAAAPTGTQITNRATIIFDTEEPIITNTVTNTLDAELPTSAVAPLPATSSPTFTLSWSGDDIANGSGIGSFDIWVSENDGPYQPYLSGTTETSAEFSGVPGSTYRFYSIGRDNAGNVEAAPSIPDAATTIGQEQPNPTPTLTGLNPTSKTAGGPQLTLTVNGTNFVTASALHWNNSPRPTTYVSSTQLVATIPASDIANEGTANVTVVNPSPGGGTSNALTFTVTPAPTCAQDVSNGVTVSRGGFRLDRATGRFVQSVTLSNTGGAAIAPTVSLVLDNLSSNATLFNKSGDTSCAPPLGSPYINIDVGDDGVFSPGETVTIVLEFDNPTQSGITYSTRVLAGNVNR